MKESPQATGTAYGLDSVFKEPYSPFVSPRSPRRMRRKLQGMPRAGHQRPVPRAPGNVPHSPRRRRAGNGSRPAEDARPPLGNDDRTAGNASFRALSAMRITIH